MAVDEIIEKLATLPPHELWRVKAAVDGRLSGSRLAEDELLHRLESQGLLTRPRRGPTYDPVLEPPLEVEGEPLSETLLRERR